jgi:arsenite-transporting ATPase
VLLVSTDPASNLDAVLGTELANSPTPIAGVPNLQAMNIDPEQATREHREQTVGPYRGVLPPIVAPTSAADSCRTSVSVRMWLTL